MAKSKVIRVANQKDDVAKSITMKALILCRETVAHPLLLPDW